jgi:hydrogenase nickel incorporation protein HypB
MTEITVEKNLLEDNARTAEDNRKLLAAARVYMLNLMSGPGAGKTTLLQRTLERMQGRMKLAVIAGDIETRRDADRLSGLGAQVLQLNTRGECHLEARQVGRALRELDMKGLDAVIIENVGNLVCPAEFDLGEHDKAMVLSVTEGADKPGKYPLMFRESKAMVLSKVDLLPYVDFNVEAAVADARAVNPAIEVIKVSSRSGENLDGWLDWLEGRVKKARG